MAICRKWTTDSFQAAETQRHALRLFGDQPLLIAYESHLSLARISYEWNDLGGALDHGEKSIQLARQYDETIDRYVICAVFLARLKLALGDADGAAAMLADASQAVRRHNFVHRIPEVAATQVILSLRQGNLAAAAHLAQTHKLPISQARVYLAQDDPSAALAILELVRRQVEAQGWEDERLRTMLLQAIVLQAHGDKEKAVQLLGDGLALAEPEGFIRIFIDEGMPMVDLLSRAAAHGIMPDYVGKLLAAFGAEEHRGRVGSDLPLCHACPASCRASEPTRTRSASTRSSGTLER